MKTYHPLYGEMEVPEEKDRIEGDLAVAKELLAEKYNSVILAYQDMLEAHLDMYRREENV